MIFSLFVPACTVKGSLLPSYGTKPSEIRLTYIFWPTANPSTKPEPPDTSTEEISEAVSKSNTRADALKGVPLESRARTSNFPVGDSGSSSAKESSLRLDFFWKPKLGS